MKEPPNPEKEVEKNITKAETTSRIVDGKEVWPAVCEDCGELTEVPFKPKSPKGIKCKKCYAISIQ